jgi:D-hydroxyproline dehydrogenase subunit alpha
LPAEFHAERPEHGSGFAELCERIKQHERITHLAETSVWAIEPVGGSTHRLRLQTGPADAPGRRMSTIDTRALVLATGAYDRVLPFPGWDLPGVYAAGAAQALAKGQRVAVGKRVLLAGTGPFLLPVTESLLGVGAEVVGLLDANRPAAVLKGWLTDPLVASRKFREAAAYGALLARHRIRLQHGRTVIAANGADRVESVTVARLDRDWCPVPGTERRIEVDAVCLGFGFTAQLELAVSARCELGAGPDGGPAVVVDDHQQTSVPGVFAAGELTGIGGADLAAAEGRVAGAAAAAVATGSAAPEDQQAVVKGKRFAAALAKAYPIKPGWQSWSTGSTLVCRCEEVTRDDLRDAVVERDVLGTRSLKLSSRAGLGLCQGRVCSRTVAELAAAYRPGVRADLVASARRPIAVPVRLRDLAATPEPNDSQEEL